jgi:hypothetical protein
MSRSKRRGPPPRGVTVAVLIFGVKMLSHDATFVLANWR